MAATFARILPHWGFAAILLAASLTGTSAMAQDDTLPDIEFNAEMPDLSSDGVPSMDPSSLDFDFSTDEFEGFEDGPEIDPELEAQAAAMAATVTIFALIMALLGFLLLAFVAYLLSDALKAIPESHRQLSPMIPWLLLVPVVNIVILFLAFIKVPQSLQSYLSSIGDTSQGDCGQSNGLWGSVLYILGCTFPIGLVLLIMSLMKIGSAKAIAKSTAT